MNNTEISRNALFAMGGRVAAGLMVVVLFSACGGLPTSGPSGNKVVALGELDPEHIITPGIFVQHVVQVAPAQ